MLESFKTTKLSSTSTFSLQPQSSTLINLVQLKIFILRLYTKHSIKTVMQTFLHHLSLTFLLLHFLPKIKILARFATLCFTIFLMISCASINIELTPYPEQSTSFTHYSHYGLWGLVGSDSINIQSACVDGEPVQIRNYFNFEDFLFAISTLGLYSPKSTEIWCEIPNQDFIKL